jgi:RNA polymerase-binding protein DksA
MDTEHFREKLEQQKADLETRMSSVGRKSSTVPGDWENLPAEQDVEPDPIDQAEVTAERENSVAILEALESQYDAVMQALGRIEKGTYGACEVCGQPIAEERLEANPSAMTCVQHM